MYYKVESNRETGDERSDLVLYQQDVAQNAVILEFKVCGKMKRQMMPPNVH